MKILIPVVTGIMWSTEAFQIDLIMDEDVDREAVSKQLIAYFTEACGDPLKKVVVDDEFVTLRFRNMGDSPEKFYNSLREMPTRFSGVRFLGGIIPVYRDGAIHTIVTLDQRHVRVYNYDEGKLSRRSEF